MKTRIRPLVSLWLMFASPMVTLCFRAQAQSYTYNGVTFTMDQVAKFAPDVRFTPWEPYLPISIENLLTGAVLHGKNGKVISNPTQQDLAQYGDSTATIEINANEFGGDPAKGEGPVRLITAPVYASVQVASDKSYVVLNYFFVSGFNGAQTMRNTSGAPGHFNYIIRTLAEHEGDLESISVWVKPDFSAPIIVRYEAHGDSSYYKPADVDWTDGTHPQVRAGLDSHASYNGKGLNPVDWIVLADEKIAEVVDIVSNGYSGFTLANVQTGKIAYVPNGNGNRVTMVDPSQVSPYSVWNLGGDPNGWCAVRPVHDSGQNLNVFGGSAPGTGVGTWGWSGGKPNEVWQFESKSNGTWVIHSRVAPNMVLSIDPTSPDGGLIITTYQPGKKAQLWRRADAGVVWRPYEQHNGVRLLGLDGNGNPVGSQLWATYKGKLGTSRTNKYTAVVDVSGGSLNSTEHITADEQAGLAANWKNTVKTFGGDPGDFFEGTAPDAPGSTSKTVLNETVPAPAPPSGDVYIIYSNVGPNMVLSINKSHPSDGLIIDTYRPGDTAECWYKTDLGDNFTLINQQTGQIAYVPNGNGNRVTMFPACAVTEYSTWTVGGNFKGWCAVRPVHDSGQNLNVFGGSAPGAGVGTWGWSGGKPNEVWHFGLAPKT